MRHVASVKAYKVRVQLGPRNLFGVVSRLSGDAHYPGTYDVTFTRCLPSPHPSRGHPDLPLHHSRCRRLTRSLLLSAHQCLHRRVLYHHPMQLGNDAWIQTRTLEFYFPVTAGGPSTLLPRLRSPSASPLPPQSSLPVPVCFSSQKTGRIFT
jgi:hypothetical protein